MQAGRSSLMRAKPPYANTARNWTLHVDLQHGGGYDGRVTVAIHAEDPTVFGADWEGRDPTRFPARIKAAATALLNCGCERRFELSHMGGSLTIQAI